MTREYARGPRGERVKGYVPRNRGTVTTMIGAMGLDGVRAMMTVEGAADAEVTPKDARGWFARCGYSVQLE